jgi:hypothetical protein
MRQNPKPPFDGEPKERLLNAARAAVAELDEAQIESCAFTLETHLWFKRKFGESAAQAVERSGLLPPEEDQRRRDR